MKNAIVYYSYTGHTKKLAEELAGKSGAELIEIKDKKRLGMVGAFVAGSFSSLRMKGWDIEPEQLDLSEYNGIIVLGPVWANYPAPAVITLLHRIPSGKGIGVIMVSDSGKSGAEKKIRQLLEDRGCSLRDYKDAQG